MREWVRGWGDLRSLWFKRGSTRPLAFFCRGTRPLAVDSAAVCGHLPSDSSAAVRGHCLPPLAYVGVLGRQCLDPGVANQLGAPVTGLYIGYNQAKSRYNRNDLR